MPVEFYCIVLYFSEGRFIIWPENFMTEDLAKKYSEKFNEVFGDVLHCSIKQVKFNA